MALRKSSVLAGLFALGFSCWVTALGLGELTLHSTLDEPFDAEIALLNIGDTDENQIFVGLASKEDFSRAGVSWEFHLLNLTFKADLSDTSHPFIKVTSREAIKEPYLDFVAQLEWPSGRLLREYTLFLDLPVFDPSQAVSGAEVAAVPPATGQTAAVAAPASAESVVAHPVQTASLSTPTTSSAKYRVKGGDTLWKIASQTALGQSSVQQRMVAIHADNPSAFVNGNANLLKKGAVLRMPDLSRIEQVNQEDAKQRVAGQFRDWNEKHQQKTVRELMGDVPEPTASDKAVSSEGLLRLSTPTATSTATAQRIGRTPGSGSGSAGSDVLQNELGVAQEELDRSKRENLELKAKLAGLEAQLNTQSKLLELESDELKAVQLGVGAAQETEQKSSEAASAAVVDTDKETAANKKPDTASRAVDQPVVGVMQNLLLFLQANWMPLLGLVVVLLGVLFLIAKSKKEEQPEQVEPFLSTDTGAVLTEDEETFDGETVRQEEPLVEDESLQAESESEPSALDVVEEVDPIGEADIYQSLGNFSEAESVIEKAITAAPNDSKLHLKRLDLFAAQQDIKGFDAYYPTLVALADSTATATADRLRANIPEDVSEAPVEAERELTLEEKIAEELGIEGLELDLSDTVKPGSGLAGALEDEPEDEPVARDNAVLSGDVEADLDSSFVDSGESEQSQDEAEGELDLSDIELDLGDIELGLETSEAAEGGDESDDLGDLLFDDIALPDELESLSAEIDSETVGTDVGGEDGGVLSDDTALSELSLEQEDDEVLELSMDSLDFDSDDDLDLDIAEDESNTQLELAQAYVEMGDEAGAKDILSEVLGKGSDEQKQQANELLAKLS